MARMRALITGASGGIGLELARLFARDGHQVLLVARSGDKLRALAGELRGEAIELDLADPAAPQELLRRTGPVDFLVNNAGFGLHGRFTETDAEVELRMIRLNISALTHLTKLYLPEMVRRRQGRIMNVASLAGFLPGPYMAVYYATKAYVLSFSEAIHAESEGTGVSVTALCPGPTRTGFGDVAQVHGTKLFDQALMSAAEVARIGYDGMLAGKPVVVTGLQNRIMAQATRFAPRGVLRSISKSLTQPAEAPRPSRSDGR